MFCNLTIDFGGVNFPTPHKMDGVQYVGFVAVFSGCARAARGNPCPDCQNPSLWDFNAPRRYTIDDMEDFVRAKKKNFDAVFDPIKTKYFLALLGGEPLDQDISELYAVWACMSNVFSGGFSTVCFTGYPSVESIPPKTASFVLWAVDYLKLGPYLGNEYKKENLSTGLATDNQFWVKISDL